MVTGLFSPIGELCWRLLEKAFRFFYTFSCRSFLLVFEEISFMAEEETVRLRHRFIDVTNSQIAETVDVVQPKSTKDAAKFWQAPSLGVPGSLELPKIFEA